MIHKCRVCKAEYVTRSFLAQCEDSHWLYPLSRVDYLGWKSLPRRRLVNNDCMGVVSYGLLGKTVCSCCTPDGKKEKDVIQ